MNTTKALENRSAINEVASLLIPMVDCQLLVPTVTVAEMVPYRPAQAVESAPEWYLGEIMWREQAVPMVCYEVLNGGELPSYNATCRIAVLNNTGLDDSLPFIAIPTQGIPRLSRVKADELSHVADAKTKPYDYMAVFHAGESVIIPDVAALEQAFLDYKKN